MLFPRYSIGRLLLIMAVSSVFCVVLAAAVRGEAWGIAVSAAVASGLLVFMIHALFFVVAWCVTLPFTFIQLNSPTKAFTEDGREMPPQLVEPPPNP